MGLSLAAAGRAAFGALKAHNLSLANQPSQTMAFFRELLFVTFRFPLMLDISYVKDHAGHLAMQL